MAGRKEHTRRSHYNSHARIYTGFSMKALRAQEQRKKHETIVDRLKALFHRTSDK